MVNQKLKVFSTSATKLWTSSFLSLQNGDIYHFMWVRFFFYFTYLSFYIANCYCCYSIICSTLRISNIGNIIICHLYCATSIHFELMQYEHFMKKEFYCKNSNIKSSGFSNCSRAMFNKVTRHFQQPCKKWLKEE